MIRQLSLLVLFLFGTQALSLAQDIPTITGVERQPLIEATKRLGEALNFAGAPLNATQQAALQEA